LFLALALFVLTRALTLTSFPIFNDEAIYLQYSQLIHDNWEQNKYISMNGQYGDWKPPLQYWITAPVISLGNDPLVVGRVIAAIASLMGLFGFYFFTKEFFSQKEAVLAAILYVMCPPVLFHNNQFTAETFLFSTAPFLYWSVLKGMALDRKKIIWTLAAILFGTGLLLFKQSGTLLLWLTMALPFTRLRGNDTDEGGSWNWQGFGKNVALVTGIVLGSHLLASVIIPSEFNATRENFDRQWIMSSREILQLPVETWRANLQIAVEYVDCYYSWGVILLFCAFLWMAIQKRDLPELALAAMCLVGAGAVILVLRGFNEYILNTAVIAVLLPVLARSLVMIWNLGRAHKEGLIRAGGLVLIAITVSAWIYQIVLMAGSPGKYLERSSNWAVANYLKGWPTGFGVKELVAMLANEKEPGVVFTDAQFGNPGTALEIYAKERFPQLLLVRVSREFMDVSQVRQFKELAKRKGRCHYAIYSADVSGGRKQWLTNMARELCETRTDLRAEAGQMPIMVCRF
jgi:hypothetical protein